jgi:hypothetical protein
MTEIRYEIIVLSTSLPVGEDVMSATMVEFRKIQGGK